MNKKMIASLAISGCCLLLGILLYPFLPTKMASHWGITGQANGYMDKVWAILLLPVIMVVCLLALWFFPKVDPLRKNIDQFRKYYDSFIVLLISFLAYLYGLTLVWNLGFKFSMVRFLIPAFAVLFYYLGSILPDSRPNWIFGIRTPWTLSNGRVWYRTHQVGGRLFKLSALLSLIGFIWPNHPLFFLIVPIVASSLYLAAYSYLVYREEMTK